MTTYILKTVYSPLFTRIKFGPKLTQKDRIAVQKQLSEMAQNGIARK